MPATEKIWRPLRAMHRIFLASVCVLLAATFLMMARDEARDWRKYQVEADQLKIEQLEKQLNAYQSDEFITRETDLKKAVVEAERLLQEEPLQTRIHELQKQQRDLQSQADLVGRQTKFRNAERDVARANFDLKVRDENPRSELEKSLTTFDAQANQAHTSSLKLQQIQAELRAVKEQLTGIFADKTAAESALSRYRADRQRLNEQLALVSPNHPLLPADKRSSFSAAKRSLKEMPILNGFNPHHSIQYEWPQGLEIQLGMTRVNRVDRCRSCHVNINEFNGELAATYPADEYHQPFASHPHPELFLTSGSPHPIEKFGCTICHEGDGSGTSFQASEHTPRDPAMAHEWAQKFGWHSNHFWEYPMRPSHLAESSCLRCHHSVVELGVNPRFGATAPKLVEGYELIKSFGCFGCHEINGFDGQRSIGPDLRLEPETPAKLASILADSNASPPGTLRKVGPSLRHVGSKVTPEFISYWTEDPQRFRPSTKMPKFFHLGNQDDALAKVMQPVELAAIAAYLDTNSEKLDLMQPADGYVPDSERGKIAFAQRGCLACHSRKDEGLEGSVAEFGPDLTNIHEKIRPGQDGFNWLYTWLNKPDLHHSKTRMPDLFLQPQQVQGATVDPAADIAAYLLEGGAREFPKQEFGGPSLGLVYEVAAAKRGVMVAEVLPTGPSARGLSLDVNGQTPLGLDQKPRPDFERQAAIKAGDVILQFNNQPVTSGEQLDQLVAAAGAGKVVQLKVLTNGLERLVEVRISTPLEDLTRLFLSKALPDAAMVSKTIEQRRFDDKLPDYAYQQRPDGTSWNLSEFVKGDEIELVAQSQGEQIDEALWNQRQLEYVGRRTISRYGCYGCHEIPGFEEAKPIGTALQDWGRKDTSKLAPEHILEFLNHHGEPGGKSTRNRIESIVKRETYDKDASEADKSAAYFYDSLQHHGRDGFLWQKLRDPRSYDYRKTESKGWDERLRMPQFPLNEQQIESVATFVLGLVNDPPSPQFQYRPTGPAHDRIEGERLLAKFNCGGCHVLDLPSVTYKAPLAEMIGVSRDELVNWFADNAGRIQTGAITQDAAAGRAAADAIEPESIRPALARFVTNAEGVLIGQLDSGIDLKTGLLTHLANLATQGRGTGLQKWLDQHPETLLADAFSDADHPEALRLLLKLKPPVSGLRSQPDKAGRALIEAHGLLTGLPDPEEEDPELRQYGLDLWQTLDLDGRLLLPGGRIVVAEKDLVSKGPGRGGAFAHWLVTHLNESMQDVNKAWQSVPPPLYKQGIKTQTPWLYRFLRNPEQIRYTTVLRMPRFNMTDDEARILANYFAAVDGVSYPYQSIPQQEPQYLATLEQQFRAAHPGVSHGYETEAWKMLNGPLCAKCHQVGGHPYQSTDPKDIRGPNLDRVERRLQSDWTRLWVYKPTWVTPYTSMPVNFPANKPQFPDLFGANSREQVEATVYSLMNYSRILELLGVVAYQAPAAEGAPAVTPAPESEVE